MREQRGFWFSNDLKVSVKTKNTYCGNANKFKVDKKGSNVLDFYTSVIPLSQVNHISEKKKKDFGKILMYITPNEKAQQFYNEALADVKYGYTAINIVVYDERETFV